MNIEIRWHNAEHTRMHHIYARQWTWEHLETAIRDSIAMLDNVDHPVDLIVEFLPGASRFPMGNIIARFKMLAQFVQHPRLRNIVAVNLGKMIEAFADVFKRLHVRATEKTFVVSSLDEARRLLESMLLPNSAAAPPPAPK